MNNTIRLSGTRAVFWLVALAALPCAAQKADPADPAAPVPATRYVPMVVAPIAKPATSPAANWRALNETVAKDEPLAAPEVQK